MWQRFLKGDRSRTIALISLGLILLVIPLTVLLSREQQENRTRALKATTLSFGSASNPGTVTSRNVGQSLTLDIMLTPGTNLVSLVRLEIMYDQTKFNVAANGLDIDETVFPTTLENPTVANGKVTGSYSIGNDTTKVIQTPTKIGTLTLTAAAATNGNSSISFGPGTEVYSLGFQDQTSENVLASSLPASVAVIGPTPTPTPVACNPNTPGIMTAMLSGAGEIPATPSTATGVARFILDTTAHQMDYTITINGLAPSQITGVHIHGPTILSVTAPILHTMYPNGSGAFRSTGELTGTNVFGSSTLTQYMILGLTYVNIHTTAYPDGEIRGQLQLGCGTTVSPTPTIVVPTNTLTPTPTRTPTPTATNTPSPTPTRTPTPTATITPTPANSAVTMNLFLHNIGNSGDNVEPNLHSNSNKNPLRKDRQFTVFIHDLDGDLITQRLGTLQYSSASGSFRGTVDLGQNLNGQYLIKAKTNSFLRRNVSTAATISTSTTVNLPSATLVAGDVLGNNALDILDYNVFVACARGTASELPMTDPSSQYNSPECAAHPDRANADLNDDGLVNRSDLTLFLRELSVQGGE